MANYLKQLLKRAGKHKTYTLINITGLAAGLTCLTLISLWIKDELSYDRFHEKYERIVRLAESKTTESGTEQSARTSAPMAAALRQDFPEIEQTVRMRMKEELVQQGNRQTLQPGILLTDQSFFDVFSFRLLSGAKDKVLSQPYTVVLTKTTAKKYFGKSSPLGQSLNIFMNDTTGRGASYIVTGVVEDPPKNSHFEFTMLASFNTLEKYDPAVLSGKGWTENKLYTYLLLKPGVDINRFTKKISHFYLAHPERPADFGSAYSYWLQPLSAIHLRSSLQHEIAPGGNIDQVHLFAIVGILILLLAAINYTNLSTVQSIGRAKEVGIKKIIGVSRSKLIYQHLLESVLITFIALPIALISTELLQPIFTQVTGKQLSILDSPAILIFLSVLTIILGILSSLYPAFVLSSFQPITVLKGSFKTSLKGKTLRKVLTIAQFAVTLVLVTAIVVVYSQMDYIRHKDLGYNKDALLYIRLNGNSEISKGYTAFKNELLKNPSVERIGISNSLIVGGLDMENVETKDLIGRSVKTSISSMGIGEDYMDVYQIKLLAGRMDRSMDGIHKFVVNEAAVKQFGWKNAANAIGKPLELDGRSGTVMAVVKDFHYNSLQHGIGPLAMYAIDQNFSRITPQDQTGKHSRSYSSDPPYLGRPFFYCVV